MQAVLPSEQAVETIENAVWEFSLRLGELWSWGYESGMCEPHRWHAGVLHGYWLAVPDEAAQVFSEFAELRHRLESIEFVAGIDRESYDVSTDGPHCGPLSGEKWRFRFGQPVEYTHRHDEGTGGNQTTTENPAT